MGAISIIDGQSYIDGIPSDEWNNYTGPRGGWGQPISAGTINSLPWQPPAVMPPELQMETQILYEKQPTVRPMPRPFKPIGNDSTFEAATVAQPNFNFDKLSDSITRFSDAIDRFSASQPNGADKMQMMRPPPGFNPAYAPQPMNPTLPPNAGGQINNVVGSMAHSSPIEGAIGQVPPMVRPDPRPFGPDPRPSQPFPGGGFLSPPGGEGFAELNQLPPGFNPAFHGQTVTGNASHNRKQTKPAYDKPPAQESSTTDTTGGNWQDWFGDFMEGLGLFGGTIGGGAAIKSAYDRLGAIGESAQQGALGIGQAGLDQTTFGGAKGTSATGSSATYDPETGMSFDLSNQEQNFMDNFLSMAQQRSQATPYGYTELAGGPESYAAQAGTLGSTFMERAGQDTGAREGEVYERIRALQREEEQGQRLAMEERLLGQGRLGVGTAQFGGTPEQLAMEKAQATSQNQAALQAVKQAQAEQLQQAQLGQAYTMMSPELYQAGQGLLGGQGDLAQQALGLAYMPQAQQMNLMNQALQGAGMTQQGQLYGAGLFGEAAMGGLEALLGSGLGQANLMGTLGTSLMSGAAQQGGWGDIDWGSILEGLGGSFGGGK